MRLWQIILGNFGFVAQRSVVLYQPPFASPSPALSSNYSCFKERDEPLNTWNPDLSL
jgi:hypothetical protein